MDLSPQISPVPTNATVVQSFHGTVNYPRSYIHHFAEMATPLTDLFKKAKEFIWGTKQLGVRDLQAEVEGLKARLRKAEDENRQLRRQQSTFSPLMKLPPELRMLIWESSLPGPRVLRISEIPTHGGMADIFPESMAFFCGARPPALLHTCSESRQVALKHFKPLFETRPREEEEDGGKEDEIARPIYFRPKLDILYIDTTLNISDMYPEINEVESLAIPARRLKNLWKDGHFRGVKKLFLVTALEQPWPSNRCCATIEFSPNPAGKQDELDWTRKIAAARKWYDIPNTCVESVVGKLNRHNCYLESVGLARE